MHSQHPSDNDTRLTTESVSNQEEEKIMEATETQPAANCTVWLLQCTQGDSTFDVGIFSSPDKVREYLLTGAEEHQDGWQAKLREFTVDATGDVSATVDCYRRNANMDVDMPYGVKYYDATAELLDQCLSIYRKTQS